MKKAYEWLIRLITGKWEKIKKKQDERFRLRIDRVYFRQDGKGIKHLEGNYRLDGNLWATGFISAKGQSITEEKCQGLVEYRVSQSNTSE